MAIPAEIYPSAVGGTVAAIGAAAEKVGAATGYVLDCDGGSSNGRGVNALLDAALQWLHRRLGGEAFC